LPTAFIHDTPIHVPEAISPGHQLSADEAAVLNNLWLGLFTSRLRWFINRTEGLTSSDVHAKAQAIDSELDLSGLGSEPDKIWDEAMSLARELISRQLEADGLPPPTNIDLHAEELVNATPSLLAQAQQRVEVRRLTIASMYGKALSL